MSQDRRRQNGDSPRRVIQLAVAKAVRRCDYLIPLISSDMAQNQRTVPDAHATADTPQVLLTLFKERHPVKNEMLVQAPCTASRISSFILE